MGGKSKQAQRTKNNMRPATSARSAELLLNSSVPAFIGFSTVENSGLMGFDQIFDENSALDSTFHIILKKMNKRDPTTKTKALQEFAALVQNSNVELVKTILPFWPRIYSNLSTDVENRVRESTQKALQAIVTKVGKEIGPYLKQIVPCWLTGQFDNHAPSSSVASACFHKAFPPNKVVDVFAFCEDDILEYFVKNLTEHNPQTICNPKQHTPEECEAKYQRMILASLRGYSMYLNKIPPEKLKLSATKNSALIDHQKFWSYYKNKNPSIRSAWFEVIASLLQFAPFLIGQHEKQLTNNVFSQIDESDPLILANLWACVLLVQVNIENWHSYLNLDAMVFPKLWKVLKTAPNATLVFPHLLPLISNFNSTILPDSKLLKFYTNFFENIGNGLRNASQGSRSEITAIATAYYEILKYITIQLANDSTRTAEELQEICFRFLDDHLVAVIFWCINAETSAGKYIFHHIAEILNYWCQNSNDKQIYGALLDRFWTELYQVFKSSLETNQNIEKVTNSQVDLIQQLKNYAGHQKSKSVKVKFSEAADEIDSPAKESKEPKKPSFQSQLNQLVYKLCDIYVEKITETHNHEFIGNLEILFKDHQSLELFAHLAQSKNQTDNICSLYDTFSQWLFVEELRCEAVIEIILVLYKYLRPSEKVDLLNKWIQIPIKTVQSWIILRALSHPLCLEPDIGELLKMPEVTNHLVECATNVANGVLKENLIILHKCFFQTESGDILINVETCDKIISIVCQPLSDATKLNSLDSCGSFLAQIMPVICSDERKKELQQKVFLIMFEFSINRITSDDLSEDTIWEVTTSWQDALSSEDLTLDDYLLESCAKITETKLSNISLKDLTIENLEKFSEIVSKLILCSTECIQDPSEKSKQIEKVVMKLFNQRAGEIKKHEQFLVDLSCFIEILNGNLIVKNLEDNLHDSQDFETSLNEYFRYNLFVLNVILKLSCHIKKNRGEEPKKPVDVEIEDEIEYSDLRAQIDEEYTDDYIDVDESLLKIWPEEIFERFLGVAVAESVSNILVMKSTNLNPQLEIWLIYLQEKLSLCIKTLPDNLTAEIKSKLFSLANTQGKLWAKSLHLLKNIKQYSDPENGVTLLYEDAVLSSNHDENILSYCNILQTFASEAPAKCLPITPNLFENYFNLLVKVVSTRCLIENHLKRTSFNEIEDRKIIGNALIVMNEILTKQKQEAYLLCNENISQAESEKVLLAAEVAHLLADVLDCFPYELDIKRWDFIRITLSSWVLTVSKSCDSFKNENVLIFIASVYRLHASLNRFLVEEKSKSSTKFLTDVIEEWENVFARETNKVLLKMFMHFMENLDNDSIKLEYFVNSISSTIATINFNYILEANKLDATTSIEDLIKFALKNFNSKYHSVSISSANIIKQLTRGLVKIDQDLLVKRNSQEYDDDQEKQDNNWHILEAFRETLEVQNVGIKEFVEDFNFKVIELDSLKQISPKDVISYLLLWDCLLNICSTAPPELRSIYARWISENEYEQTFLQALFRMMPRDVLKNPETASKSAQNYFLQYDWSEISKPTVTVSRYAAFMYSTVLKTLPAIVRKWCNGSNSRHAHIIEKITGNFVSPLICQQELTALLNKKEENDNLDIKVHQQSRQVTASYTLEEAKMELLITLPANHPLGTVKVEPTKLIKGKMHAQQVVMQLTIFLTHQNGSIWDGLMLWKRNLDRKFEGVQECYVCYSVIHQESYQLPRLTCKTCKNKFHGTCLYRWFHSANKSTCPICRNMF